MVKCWDLEYNKVVRHYHGHLSGVFTLSLHPILDLLISGGRDSVARVWDMRTKNQVHVLGGHVSTVSSILTAGVDPQVPFPFHLVLPNDTLITRPFCRPSLTSQVLTQGSYSIIRMDTHAVMNSLQSTLLILMIV